MLTEGFSGNSCDLGLCSWIGSWSSRDRWKSRFTSFDWSRCYLARYESWSGAKGLGAKVGAFVDGAANLLKAIGLSPRMSVALMGVFVASFAATTLDTACRLQRYVTQELAATIRFRPLQGKHGASLFAIVVAVCWRLCRFLEQLGPGRAQVQVGSFFGRCLVRPINCWVDSLSL